MPNFSKPQLALLQTLYSQYSRRAIELDSSRECRLRWASEQLGREVTSFSGLSHADGRRLIDLLQGAMGIASKPRRRPRRNDHAAGTEGRHDGAATVRTMPTQADIDRIQTALQRLGWSVAQYEAWLRSTRSPLARKAGRTRIAPTDITLRTLADYNRVWWALKGMLKREGRWNARN